LLWFSLGFLRVRLNPWSWNRLLWPMLFMVVLSPSRKSPYNIFSLGNDCCLSHSNLLFTIHLPFNAMQSGQLDTSLNQIKFVSFLPFVWNSRIFSVFYLISWLAG
jgi:hypothetical protein